MVPHPHQAPDNLSGGISRGLCRHPRRTGIRGAEPVAECGGNSGSAGAGGSVQGHAQRKGYADP